MYITLLLLSDIIKPMAEAKGEFLQPQKENPTVSRNPNQLITLESFIADFPKKTSKLETIPSLPTIEEAKILASLTGESIIILGKDNKIYIAKGEEKDISGSELKAQLQDLEPKFMAHTHIPPSNAASYKEQDLKYRLNMPSPVDLVTDIKATDIRYVYTKYGRVTYRAIPDKMQSREGSMSLLQSQILNVINSTTMKARQSGIKDAMEGFNYVGAYLGRYFRCGFMFESWEEVKDIQKPPDKFLNILNKTS